MNKLTRRAFHSTLATAAASAQSARPKPNIVFVLSDDHSVPHLGCYGDPVVKTPNLDKLASEGMRFERAFTAAPQCVPSRTAMMTGRSPVAARMGRFSSPLPPDVITLPEILREAGYFTGVCRRWFHLDGPNNPGPVSKAIFDKHNMRTWQKRVDYLDSSPPQQTTARVDEFLNKAGTAKPFFLWVNFNDPHHVWDPKAIANPYDPAKVRLPAHMPDLPGVREDHTRYFGEITRMDSEFQSVLDTLNKRGALDNTLVVFMGDNGYAFPRGKGSLYDGGLNVPLIARWPGRITSGAVSRSLISGEDITPTLLDAAGAKPHPSMTGRSFLPLLRGDSYQPRSEIYGARLYHGNSPYTATTKASTFDLSRCVRTDRYKLIYNCTPQQEYSPVDSANDPGWKQIVAAHQARTLAPQWERIYFNLPRPVVELYDLEADPSELNNLAGRPEHVTLERELKIKLQEKMIVDYDFLPLPLGE